jgi:hypothetical protein
MGRSCKFLTFFSFSYLLLSVRYEFAPNEFVNCIDSVMLETSSVEAGYKEFIAVGTSINRGEDLAVKGVVSS